MSRRIEIELTSRRDDGTWTWRAAGAREPKGVVEAALVPGDAKVNDVLRAEVESDLDGTRVLTIAAPKGKAARAGLLEILPSNEPFEPVTQKLARKGSGQRRDKKSSRGPSRRGGEGGTDSGEGRRERPKRPFFETPPELPQRPRPKRIRPGRENVDAVLAELPEAQRAIAEKVLSGGIPAVRAAVQEQNKAAVAEGREKIPMDGLIAIAEQLTPRLRSAEWRDRAIAATKILEEIDLRDLRSVVASAENLPVGDDDTRELVARMKGALVTRQEVETRNWLDDVEAATKVGRVVRALKLSSQPPKAGVPFPAALAAQLSAAAVGALTPDAPAERWIAVLEAAAFSPVRTHVLPSAPHQKPNDELTKTVVRLGPLMPQVAALFGITVDPKAKAPRPLQPGRERTGKKPARQGDKATGSADRKPRPERATTDGRKPTKAKDAGTAGTADVAQPAPAEESVLVAESTDSASPSDS